MKFNICLLLFLLGAALTQASPVSKTVEKKSLTSDSKVETAKEDLKIEESGDDKDRSKKAALCLQIEPDNQFATVQQVPLNLVQPQGSFMLPQQMVQSIPQPLSNFVLPQQVQPLRTLQIVQPSQQPCSSSVNVIQAPAKSTAIEAPKPKKLKIIETEVEEVPVTEEPKKPMLLPPPQEALTVLPVVPAYQDIAILPEPEQTAFIQVPMMPACANPLHGLVQECTCQQVPDPMTMNLMPVVSYPSAYPSAYASSSVMMPHMIANPVQLGPQARTRTYVNVNVPHTHSHSHAHIHPNKMQKMYVSPYDPDMHSYGASEYLDSNYGSGALTINAFPQYRNMPAYKYNTLRSKQNIMASPNLSEVQELSSSNKLARETDSTQLSPEKMEETKQEVGKATLIDGRRNIRSNKEETKKKSI